MTKDANPSDTINEESPLLFDSSTNPTTQPAFEGASWWSQLVFGWLDPILELGHIQDQLNPEDLDISPLAPEDSTAEVMKSFNEAWEKECQRVAAINEEIKKKASNNRKGDKILNPSLTRALFMAFGRDFMKAGGLKVINDCLQLVGPQGRVLLKTRLEVCI